MNEHRVAEVVEILAGAGRVAVLTGAGISAESGVPTFRGADGLWKQYRAETLATPEAFARDPKLVWEWYDWRRGLIAPVEPNAGHRVIAGWESLFPEMAVITQNVDGLHAKAGSRDVVELHGNIWKLRCTREGTIEEVRATPLPRIPPVCPACGCLFRPHIVWFGESLDPAVLDRAYGLSEACQVMFVIGTSAIVHPAASLPYAAAKAGATIIEVNLEPTPLSPHADFFFQGKAGEILPVLDRELRERTRP
ncbi:MAG: NAD-dependent deacylase [Candidatus Aminicenantes bacterium]|nr:NAD-dependent deacylase [Candidatus Aminicenantes bacterium]